MTINASNLTSPQTQITSAYAQRGEDRIFLKDDNLSLMTKHIDIIAKSTIFAHFFHSLNADMADIDITVLGKNIYFSSNGQTMQVKSKETLEKMDTETNDDKELKEKYLGEIESLELSAQKIKELEDTVFTHFDEIKDSSFVSGTTIDIALPPSLTPARVETSKTRVDSSSLPKTPERKTSRKMITLEKKKQELEEKKQDIDQKLKESKVNTLSDEECLKEFSELTEEEQGDLIEQKFKEETLEEIGKNFYTKQSLISKSTYTGWAYPQIGIYALKNDEDTFKARGLNALRPHLKDKKLEKIKEPLKENLKQVDLELGEIRKKISSEKKYLENEATRLDKARNVQGKVTTTRRAASHDPIYDFIAGQKAIFIPGLTSLLEKLEDKGDERIQALKKLEKKEIYYDDLLYILRHELSLITQEDGSVDRSQASFLSSENQFIQYLLPFKKGEDRTVRSDFLTDNSIEELSQSEQSLDNITLAFELMYEYYGMEYNPSLKSTEESHVISSIEKSDDVKAILSDEREHSRIERLLYYSKKLEAKSSHDSTGKHQIIYDAKKYLWWHFAQEVQNDQTLEESFEKKSAMGTSQNPGAWKTLIQS